MGSTAGTSGLSADSLGSPVVLANLGGSTTITASTADLLLTVEGDTTATTARRVGLLDALTKARGTLGLQDAK